VSDTLWVVGSIGEFWLAGTTEELNVKAVYINNTPSNVGRQSHPYFTWSNNEIVLGSLTKRGLPGNTFYFQVVNYNNDESLWFGPITILDDLRAVYINTSPVDEGKQLHPFVSWSTDSIELATLSKLGFESNEFYFQVSNQVGVTSNWFGPVVIGTAINADISLNTHYTLGHNTIIDGTTMHYAQMVLNKGASVISSGERQGEIFVSIDLNLLSQLDVTNVHIPQTVKFITLTLLYGE
jgi:hypothetical protein